MSYQITKTTQWRAALAADASLPDSAAAGIECKNTNRLLLFISAAGDEVNAKITPTWWDEQTQKYFPDPSQNIEISAAGDFVYEIKTRGTVCFPRLTSLTGDSVNFRYAITRFI